VILIGGLLGATHPVVLKRNLEIGIENMLDVLYRTVKLTKL